MIHVAAVLLSALLFGGMSLFAAGFAAVLFQSLPAASAGQVLRRAFPHFYAFVTGVAALAAGAWWPQDGGRAGVLLLVAATMVCANLGVDLLYGALDPRLRRGGTR